MIKYEVYEDFKTLLQNAPKKPKSIIDDTPSDYKKTAWWPSQLTNCRRRLVYDTAYGSDWDPDLMSEFTFAMGAAFEDVMGRKLKDADMYLADEAGFTYHDERLKMPFRGRVDYIVKIPGVDHMVPVELKTTSNRQWETKSYGDLTFEGSGDKPKTYNVAQLNLYMYKMDVPWGLLCYMNKETSQFQVYKIEKSHALQEAVVNHHVQAELDLEMFLEDDSYVPPAIMLDDDGREFEIKDIALTTYQITREGKFTKGDPKKEKYDKPNGKIGFPCIWANQQGGWSMCDRFEKCWSKKLEELDLTMDDLK